MVEAAVEEEWIQFDTKDALRPKGNHLARELGATSIPACKDSAEEKNYMVMPRADTRATRNVNRMRTWSEEGG
jgi:hypothetical protein